MLSRRNRHGSRLAQGLGFPKMPHRDAVPIPLEREQRQRSGVILHFLAGAADSSCESHAFAIDQSRFTVAVEIVMLHT